jgi:hypothetical protein
MPGFLGVESVRGTDGLGITGFVPGVGTRRPERESALGTSSSTSEGQSSLVRGRYDQSSQGRALFGKSAGDIDGAKTGLHFDR